MKKAIGGLLVVSMLTVPHPTDLNYMAYLALRNHNRVMYVQFINDDELKAGPKDIDRGFSDMENNHQMITSLIRQRTATLNKISTRLDLLRHAGIALNESQMSDYAGFMSRYRNDTENFESFFKELEGEKELNIAQREILSENTDYNIIANQLSRIIGAQHLAIDSLVHSINEGEYLLKVL